MDYQLDIGNKVFISFIEIRIGNIQSRSFFLNKNPLSSKGQGISSTDNIDVYLLLSCFYQFKSIYWVLKCNKKHARGTFFTAVGEPPGIGQLLLALASNPLSENHFYSR